MSDSSAQDSARPDDVLAEDSDVPMLPDLSLCAAPTETATEQVSNPQQRPWSLGTDFKMTKSNFRALVSSDVVSDADFKMTMDQSNFLALVSSDAMSCGSSFASCSASCPIPSKPQQVLQRSDTANWVDSNGVPQTKLQQLVGGEPMAVPKKPQLFEPFVWTPFVPPLPTDPHYQFFSDVQKQLVADHPGVQPAEDLFRVLNENMSQDRQEATDQLATLGIQLVPVGKKIGIESAQASSEFGFKSHMKYETIGRDLESSVHRGSDDALLGSASKEEEWPFRPIYVCNEPSEWANPHDKEDLEKDIKDTLEDGLQQLAALSGERPTVEQLNVWHGSYNTGKSRFKPLVETFLGNDNQDLEKDIKNTLEDGLQQLAALSGKRLTMEEAMDWLAGTAKTGKSTLSK